MVRSGALRLWLTPLPVGVPREVTVRSHEKDEVRGLGRHLTAALAELPQAPRERGG
jgi:hypothetical protein